MRNAPVRPVKSHIRFLGRGWVVVVLALAVMLPAASALAATDRFTDADDHNGFDIRAVKVRYGDRLNVRVVHDGKIAVGQKYKFWFDTKRADKGPEYSFVFTPNSDFSRMRKVESFTDPGVAVRSCGSAWGGRADIFKPHRDVLAFVAGRCLGDPGRVRVAVQLVVKGPDDWAPDAHEFGPAVSRY